MIRIDSLPQGLPSHDPKESRRGGGKGTQLGFFGLRDCSGRRRVRLELAYKMSRVALPVPLPSRRPLTIPWYLVKRIGPTYLGFERDRAITARDCYERKAGLKIKRPSSPRLWNPELDG